MELRDLKAFIALADEGSVSNAAKALHITQPTLSRQMAALQNELGTQLYLRDHRGINLTREGRVLLRYAQDIIELSRKAQDEVSTTQNSVRGKVYIGAGETQVMGIIARAMSTCKKEYPKVHFQLTSGDSVSLWDGFAKGRFDFLIECEMQPHPELNTYLFPYKDEWGVLMRCDDTLASRRVVTPNDLVGRHIMLSTQAERVGVIKQWAGEAYGSYDISCNWSLPLNSRYLVRENLGVSMSYMGLFDDEGTDLCMRPLYPKAESTQGLVWRKTPLSRQAQAFLEILIELCEGTAGAEAMQKNAHFNRSQ